MPKFPVDVPIRKVIATLERLGFGLVREGSHISMLRDNPDGTKTPLTIPNHPTIKKSTLRTILTQSGISRKAIYIDIDEKGNIVSMTIEHAKANAGLWEFSYQEMSRQTA